MGWFEKYLWIISSKKNVSRGYVSLQRTWGKERKLNKIKGKEKDLGTWTINLVGPNNTRTWRI